MKLTFSILGLIGGLLCCVGDILFDLKGAGNEKRGTSGQIDTNWEKMAYWRFGASILCAFAGDVLVGFGIYSFYLQIADTAPTLATVMLICGYIGMIGGFFVHSMVCIQPVIYKSIMEKGSFEQADYTLEKFYKAITIPFFTAYLILMVVPVCQIIAILVDYMPVPKWCALLNSIVFLIIGVAMRKIDPKRFQDLPGIIMPSLGLAMIGLVGIINLM